MNFKSSMMSDSNKREVILANNIDINPKPSMMSDSNR
jgi:hypothetical protein